MKISKFFHYVKINKDLYAIYNSLIMDIIYVKKDLYDKVLSFKVSDEEQKHLKKAGIYVENNKVDDEALSVIKDRYKKVSGRISIMYFIMSSSCNLGCKYCFIEKCQFNNKKEINMNSNTAINALNKYSDYLKENNLRGTVIFYGGEPMVNWEVIKIVIEESKRLKAPIDFSMVTNATLLDEDKIKFLSRNKVEIGISIDGPKILNDKNRIYRSTNKSVYDEVMKKFPYLKAYKTKFGLSITVSKDLLDNQDAVLKWLENLGVKSIFYNLYHYTSYDKNWNEYYKEACAFLIKSYKRLCKYDVYDGRIIRKIDSFYNNEFKFSDCGAIGSNQLAIKPNGDVCICHGYLKTDKYVIGNIINNSLEEMLKSDEIDFWKKRCTLNNKKCIKCKALFVCGGGCAIQAEALFGDRKKLDKPFCIHTKKTFDWLIKESYKFSYRKMTEKKEVR